MKTVIVAIATAATSFPAGTASAGIVITLDGFAPVTVAAAPYQAQFDNVPPGDYHATAQAIDAGGAPLGAQAVSDLFTIAADPEPGVSIDVPTTITVTVQ